MWIRALERGEGAPRDMRACVAKVNHMSMAFVTLLPGMACCDFKRVSPCHRVSDLCVAHDTVSVTDTRDALHIERDEKN